VLEKPATLTIQVPKKVDSREVERRIVRKLREKYLDEENMSWMLQGFSTTTAKELTALTFYFCWNLGKRV
jgi:hypothetical protein